jgi:hypothetical protein
MKIMGKEKFGVAAMLLGLMLGATVQQAKAAAGIAKFNTNCSSDFRLLKKHAGWKAFAVSGVYLVGTREWQSCGSAWSYSSKANAGTVSAIECRAQLRKKHAPKGTQCRVTFVSK